MCTPLKKIIYLYTLMSLNERETLLDLLYSSLLKRYTCYFSMHVNNNSYPKTVFGIAVTINFS